MSTAMKSRLLEFSSTNLFTPIYQGFTVMHWEYGIVSDEKFFERLLNDPKVFAKVFESELFEMFDEIEGHIESETPEHEIDLYEGLTCNRPSFKRLGDHGTLGIFGTVINFTDYRKCDDASDYLLPLVMEQLRDKGSEHFYDCLEKTWQVRFTPAYAYIPAGDVESLIEVIQTCTGGVGWRDSE